MARKKSSRRPPAKPFTMAWDDASHDLFRLGHGWTAPKNIQVRRTVKGATVTAVFRDEADRPVRLTTRLAWARGGDTLTIVEETMSIRLGVIRGGAV